MLCAYRCRTREDSEMSVFAFEPHETAIVTGGATGIGWAVTELLADHGVRVSVLCLDAPPQTPNGDLVHFVECDVRNEARVIEVVNLLRETWGGIDMLVNSAAIL